MSDPNLHEDSEDCPAPDEFVPPEEWDEAFGRTVFPPSGPDGEDEEETPW